MQLSAGLTFIIAKIVIQRQVGFKENLIQLVNRGFNYKINWKLSLVAFHTQRELSRKTNFDHNSLT